eukprot:Gregarina_sp_Poly_1__2969@NODE_1831_length_3253_cov_6_049278_g1189_i0_p2_GENE_NODE_1831_length_3253_cov_6_049278_g1189_i0NODE_1831_length_3253_cov_6_049278_g1189_i0_p2_ORF_typecomplete_len168_score7_12_NODE_1831_length_3253_cov_6_049278_g1189_i07531256
MPVPGFDPNKLPVIEQITFTLGGWNRIVNAYPQWIQFAQRSPRGTIRVHGPLTRKITRIHSTFQILKDLNMPTVLVPRPFNYLSLRALIDYHQIGCQVEILPGPEAAGDSSTGARRLKDVDDRPKRKDRIDKLINSVLFTGESTRMVDMEPKNFTVLDDRHYNAATN